VGTSAHAIGTLPTALRYADPFPTITAPIGEAFHDDGYGVDARDSEYDDSGLVSPT
jgi:hypothetical protein